jgi:hypothetical protein
VKGVPAFPWTVLHQLDPVRIVLLVLARRVRPLLALGAGELDRRTRLYPCHGLFLDVRDRTRADGPATLADGEPLADLEGDRVMSSTDISTWSPGMIISAPSGSPIAPVTSVVRR